MPKGRDRTEGGQFRAEHTDREVIAAVEEYEPAGTKEVANALGIARQSADYRLRKLLDEGRLSKKKVGNSLIWTTD